MALGWSLPFLARGRHPFWAPIAVCAALVALAFTAGLSTNNLTMPFVAAVMASVSFGLISDRRQSVAGWSAVVAAAAVVDYQTTAAFSDFFWTTLILTLAWFFGVALGTRTEQARELRVRVEAAERDRALAAERATAEERSRIARELHDVVAHSVSVMVVQASGVRRLLKEDQEREREALVSVEQIGRQALTEMRRMLGVMRTGEDQPAALAPQPGLQHLDRLIAQVEEAGLPVTLHIEGERPELSPGVDLSAYRIVQEGLTNALKHAKGAHADVVIRYIDGLVQLEITDDGVGSPERHARWPRARRHARARRGLRRHARGRPARRRRLRAARRAAGGVAHVIRILLVDDQALVRAGFRMILDAETEMEVVGEASDGREAIDQVRSLRPDVVLMDIRMPELDGLEAARRILADERRRRAEDPDADHLRPRRVRLRGAARRARAASCSRTRRPSSSSPRST